MLVNADAKQLEWRCAVYYSKDKVGLKEIIDEVDAHADNQARFGFPPGKEGRLIAKVFLFRLIYGGTEYSYANDPDFMEVSESKAFWKDVIEVFYDKYRGIAQWHKELLRDARLNGRLTTPSGREYRFWPKDGNWPDTTIKNYPIQGFSADLMMLARIQAFRRLIPHRDKGILLVNTVHDSIVVDCESNHVTFVVNVLKEIFSNLDYTASKCFGIHYNVPMGCDIEVGKNWLNMEKV